MAQQTHEDRLKHRALRELVSHEQNLYRKGLEAYTRLMGQELRKVLPTYRKQGVRMMAGGEPPSLVKLLGSKPETASEALHLSAAGRLAGGKEHTAFRRRKARGLPKRAHGALLDAHAAGAGMANASMRAQRAMSLKEALEAAQARLSKALPLTKEEQDAIESIQGQAYERIRELSRKIVKDTMDYAATLDIEVTRDIERSIRSELAVTFSARETVKQFEKRLRAKLGDWVRDWGRVAVTEVQSGHQAGVAKGIGDAHGDEAIVVKVPRPDACADCKRLYLDAEGNPKRFTLAELYDAGHDNSGRKRGQWEPVVGAAHPWCACQLLRLTPGMEFEGDLEAGTLEPVVKSIPASRPIPVEQVTVTAGDLSRVGLDIELLYIDTKRDPDPPMTVDDVTDEEQLFEEANRLIEQWRAKLDQNTERMQAGVETLQGGPSVVRAGKDGKPAFFDGKPYIGEDGYTKDAIEFRRRILESRQRALE